MSNTYEVLQQAQRGRMKERLADHKGVQDKNKVITLQRKRIPGMPTPEEYLPDSVEINAEKELLTLYQSINYALADYPRKIVQFIGSVDGEGASTVVREFARLLAVKLGKTVLILDAAHRRPTQHLFCDNLAHQHGWKDVVEGTEQVENSFYSTEDDNLYISPIVPQASLSSQIYNLPVTSRFMLELKQKFDFILIDSSAATVSPECLAITRTADGVVLVVEAEKTRWQVVENVKNRIEKNGGNILGIVLNKRRYHIPKRFYRYL